MINPRFKAIQTIGNRTYREKSCRNERHASEFFGAYVFTQSVMQKMLPQEVFENILQARERKGRLNPQFADAIAVAMKDWAMSHGATHYSHLFQPLTGGTAEKHDAFIDWSGEDCVIEKFSGKQLIQGEPDASSFPSGGLRSTYEARGYTGWDPTSPVFIWKAGDGATLCIPSVFFSWTGHVLDNKIPLLRSDQRISDAVLRLLRHTGIKAEAVYSSVGLEQEYFVVDRALRDLRPDLLLLGRTVFGAEPPKGQELQDHYFGSVKDRILDFMRDFETEALKLAIPVKTRHNEVAPAQYEVAPVYEKAVVATDHNIILMELMRRIALKHNLCCLLHEKPFGGLNGSGKHCNWSLITDGGINLLNPTDFPENNAHFLILLTAILYSVHKHADLLRASIGSASNDFRLGGHEAPPAIMSVYLGEALEAFLDNIEKSGQHVSRGDRKMYEFGVSALPHLSRDNTDRNRTSPFAFTGNKFEMRALGSSASPAFLITVLNVMVADCLNHMIDEIEKEMASAKISFAEAALPVVQKYIKLSKKVRYSGDNYSQEWVDEARRRNLSNFKRSTEAMEALLKKETIQAFEGILTEHEMKSRHEIALDIYATTMNIDANLMREMFYTQILPAALKQLKEFSAVSLLGEKLNGLIEKALTAARELEELRVRAMSQELSKRAFTFGDQVLSKGEELRDAVDQLEGLIDDQLWPLPKYRELLFIL